MATSTIKKVSAPDLQRSGNRNAFDMTHRRAFTCVHGQLTPACVMDLKTGDYVELSNILHTRTQPALNTPYVRLHEHLDYFFVPYAQLWKGFDNFATQQSNYDDVNLQATLLKKIPSTTPYIEKSKIIQLMTDWEIGGELGSGSTSAPVGLHRITLGTDFHRLASYLGYFGFPKQLFATVGGDSESFVAEAQKYIPELKYNPFRLAAYQKIYFDYYRNDKYESCDSEAYNFNDMPCNGGSSTGVTPSIPLARVKKLFTMRYRWRNKDYFMSTTPNILPYSSFIGFEGFSNQLHSFTIQNQGTSTQPNYGRLQSPITVLSASGYGDLSNSNNMTQSSVGGVENTNAVIKANANLSTGNAQTASNIRWLLSYERLLKRMYAAKNNFVDQMRAIFGDAPIDYRGGFVQHLGGMSNVLSFDTTYQSNVNGMVTDPAERPGSQYGQIDAKTNGGSIKFRAHECGVLMAIYSTSAETDYSPFRVDRFNFKFSYEDYFNPNFQTMGKQPLINWEFATLRMNATGPDAHIMEPITTPKVIGFVERYHEYKVPIDSVLGDFTEGAENWVAPFQCLPWADQGENLNQYNMTYSPDDISPLFGVNAQQGYSGQFLGDQFKNELVIVCNKVSDMDYIGDDL